MADPVYHDPTYREGFNAGYAGTTALRNPYLNQPYRNLWFDGHTEGRRKRKADITACRHPEYLNEFPIVSREVRQQRMRT